MKFSFAKPGLPRTGIVAVGVFATRNLCPSGVKLNKSLDGALTRAMRASRFMGNKGQTLSIVAPAGSRLDRVILIGLGKASDITELEMQNLGGKIYSDTHRAVKGCLLYTSDAADE